MKNSLAMMAVFLSVAAEVPGQTDSPAGRRAQPTRGAASTPPARLDPSALPPSTPATEPAPHEPQVFKNESVLPPPVAFEELERPKIPLPTGPIEPLLLTKNNGPFMVLAHTFRGPDATRYAQALALELRNKHGLPAYIFYLRIQPGHSNIRNVPPTAEPHVQTGELSPPESYRQYDEAAVLVGDCRTIDESEKVLHRVKKIRSEVLDGLPSIYHWRKGRGLSRAILTTNPLVASQYLFPGQKNVPLKPGQVVDPSVATAAFASTKPKPDPLLKQINTGPNSIIHCPGPYTLQVAEFLGYSTLDVNDPKIKSDSFIRSGPLAAAADKAESLADSLRRCRTMPKQHKVYVYHDRTSSKVFVGSFKDPNDPSLPELLNTLNLQVSGELLQRKFTQLPLAPASQLTPVPRF